MWIPLETFCIGHANVNNTQEHGKEINYILVYGWDFMYCQTSCFPVAESKWSSDKCLICLLRKEGGFFVFVFPLCYAQPLHDVVFTLTVSPGRSNCLVSSVCIGQCTFIFTAGGNRHLNLKVDFSETPNVNKVSTKSNEIKNSPCHSSAFVLLLKMFFVFGRCGSQPLPR